MLRLTATAFLVAPVVAASRDSLADNLCCTGCPRPVPISALDEPLRCYFMPRRPGFPRHGFQYRVAEPEFVTTGCGDCGAALPAEVSPVSPEILDLFDPLGLVRLGQIPNDSLLEASPTVQ